MRRETGGSPTISVGPIRSVMPEVIPGRLPQDLEIRIIGLLSWTRDETASETGQVSQEEAGATHRDLLTLRCGEPPATQLPHSMVKPRPAPLAHPERLKGSRPGRAASPASTPIASDPPRHRRSGRPLARPILALTRTNFWRDPLDQAQVNKAPLDG